MRVLDDDLARASAGPRDQHALGVAERDADFRARVAGSLDLVADSAGRPVQPVTTVMSSTYDAGVV